MIDTFGYFGMSYEQASKEADFLVKRDGWFKSWDRLIHLHAIMKKHLKNEVAA